MNFKEDESAQKLRGGYYTPPDIADYLTRWIAPLGPGRVLEPSAGDGRFIRALAGRARTGQAGAGLMSVTACELDPAEAEKCREAMSRLAPAVTRELVVGDFLEWVEGQLDRGAQFDAVLGNPPFIRYQYLEAPMQDRAARLIRRFDLPFTKHTNAWVPFVITSLALLRPAGRLAMVVPAELLHVLHARSVRAFLRTTCARVTIVDPKDLWFDGALQGVVLLLAERRGEGQTGPCEIRIEAASDRSFLAGDPGALFERADFTPGDQLPGKWMAALLPARARAVLHALGEHPQVHRFEQVANAAVGIVTGANKFFLVPDKVVETYGLRRFARPMFGRSEHVPGVIYDAQVHRANRDRGLPTNFIWFHGIERDTLPAKALAYVEMGEAQRLHTRYKCRIREPWFEVPSVFTAPVGMLKRSHDLPRLILNSADAYTTDTAYRVTPHGMPAEDLVFAFVNSLTALSAELEGRHYGGGVLELVPSEISQLLVPHSTGGEAHLVGLDWAWRQGRPASGILETQDELILRPLGLSDAEIAELQGAWHALRARRQRHD